MHQVVLYPKFGSRFWEKIGPVSFPGKQANQRDAWLADLKAQIGEWNEELPRRQQVDPGIQTFVKYGQFLSLTVDEVMDRLRQQHESLFINSGALNAQLEG